MGQQVSINPAQRETIQRHLAQLTFEHDILTEALPLAKAHLTNYALPHVHHERILTSIRNRLHHLDQQRTQCQEVLRLLELETKRLALVKTYTQQRQHLQQQLTALKQSMGQDPATSHSDTPASDHISSSFPARGKSSWFSRLLNMFTK